MRKVQDLSWEALPNIHVGNVALDFLQFPATLPLHHPATGSMKLELECGPCATVVPILPGAAGSPCSLSLDRK